jgi:hypothetical protein
MDNGSAHFRNREGDEVPSGMISVELTPGVTPGWRALVFHARAPELLAPVRSVYASSR